MKNTPQNTEWQERFDEFDKNEDNHHACYECEGSLMPEKLKLFIQSEKDLSYKQGREDMRKEILEGMPTVKPNKQAGWKSALSQLEKVIKEIK